MKKNRARIAILNYIVAFSTSYKYSDGSTSGSLASSCFNSAISGDRLPEIGSLCRLQSAPLDTKWYLSWLKEIRIVNKKIGPEFLLESIENGELCWWSNVGLLWIDKEQTDKWPQFKWMDTQFEFQDLCQNVRCEVDNFHAVPLPPLFDKEGDGVLLKTRRRWDGEDFTSKYFEKWWEVTRQQIKDFYAASEKEREQEFKNIRNEKTTSKETD